MIGDFWIRIRYENPGRHYGTLVLQASGIIQRQDLLAVEVAVPKINVLARSTTIERAQHIYPGDIVTLSYYVRNEENWPVRNCRVELAP